MKKDGTFSHRAAGAALLLTAALLTGATHAQTAGTLFPQPFEVEHHVVQDDVDGGFVTEPVVDRYGGSWIVSERPDGNRVVIDFARREITEIRTGAGTYTVLTFDHLAELQQRLRRAELEQVGIVPTKKAAHAHPEPTFTVERLPVDAGAKAMLKRPGVEHLRVRLDQDAPDARPLAVDVWVDAGVRLSPAARQALADFEGRVLAAAVADGEVPFTRFTAAAREHAKGAFPIRTRRPVTPAASVFIEDVVTRLDQLASFPVDLVTVPEGYRRVPHPLEQMVAFAEEEAERNLKALSAIGPGR